MLTRIPIIYKRLSKGQLIGILLAILSLASGLLLVCSSAWFITATALTGLGVLGLQGYNIFLPSAIIRFLALSKPLNKYVERIYSHRVTFNKSSSTRGWLFDKIAQMKKAELVKFRSAQLLDGLVNDIEELDHFYMGMILPWISAGILFLLAAVFFIVVLPVMLWVLTGVFLISGFIIPLLTYKGSKAQEEESLFLKRQSQMDLIAILRGFADLRQFGLLDAKRKLVIRGINSEQRLRHKSKKTLAIWQYAQQITLQAGLIVSILIISHRIKNIDGPLLVLMVISLITLFEGLIPFPALAHQFSRTTWCGNSLNEWENNRHTIQEMGKLAFPPDPDIQIDDISAFYGSRNIFESLTLRFPSYSITAVTGCNGCGKTTLLDVLCGLKMTAQGDVLIGGKRLSEIDPDELIDNIGYMEQQATLFNMSLFENVALAKPDAADRDVFNAAVRAGFGPTLKQHPEFLKKQAGESGKNISGGQARMIALARIILKDPPVLLMDEPTEGLDIGAERNLLNLLSSWKGSKTIVLVTHKKSLIAIADRHYTLQ
jgi:ATP-binding cassette, subfamily C, bacterial CydC